MCPNINNENVRNQFNSIIKAFGGAPMTIEEFKSKELRNQRSGVDDSAMQIAYSVWAKTNGEPSIGANIRQSVNNILGVNNDEVNYTLRAADILLSDKAKQVFSKGEKNKWSLDKILTELAVPKEQKALLLDLGITDREQLALELASKYGYSVEINTAKDNDERAGDSVRESLKDNTLIINDITGNNEFAVIDKYNNALNGLYFKTRELAKEWFDATFPSYYTTTEFNASYYSNLTVPGGTNYTENEISTPLITPSIKGHAQFSTDKGIGWFRSDDKVIPGEDYDELLWEEEGYSEPGVPYQPGKKTIQRIGEYVVTKTRRILEVQSDLFQKGRDKKDLVSKNKKDSEFNQTAPEWMDDEFFDKDITDDSLKQNKFLQLLNKDNNWVTFFIKSIVQDSAKKGYEKVLFPKGETAARIEGHQVVADQINAINTNIDRLSDEISNRDSNIKKSLDKISDLQTKLDVFRASANTKLADQEIYLSRSQSDKFGFEGFSSVRVENTMSRGNKFHVEELGAEYEGFYIHGYNAGVNGEKKILKISRSEANDLFESLDEEYKYRFEDMQTFLNLRSQISSENARITKLNGAEEEIERLEERKRRLKSEGIEKLAPIEAFYEIKVGNILEKQFGKDDVKTITDEYGNQWREITIDQKRDTSPILLENKELKGVSEIFAELMSPYEKGINTIKSKYKIGEGGKSLISSKLNARLVKKYNENEKMPYEIVHNGVIIKNRDFAGQNDFEVTIRVKKDFIEALQRSAERRFNEQAKAIADSDPLEAEQEMTPFQKASMAAIEITHQDARKGHSKARGGTQLSLFDSLLMSQEKVSKKASKRAIAVFVKIAEDMTKRFGVKFKVVTEAEADEIRAKNGRNIGPGYRTAGFFLNGTAYLVEGVFNGATAVHEIFGHPFLNALKRDPSLHELYNQLLVEAGKDKNAVKYIDAAYDGHSDSIKGDELILYVLGGMIDERVSADLNKSILERFFTELGKYINKVFKKNTNLNYFGPRLSLNDMADWLLYGNGSMKLVSPSDKEGVLEASASILKAIGSDGIKSINSGYLDFSKIRNAHNKDYFEAFHRFIEEFGAVNEDFILNNINSRLGWVVTENGAAKIFNLHGELSESSPMSTVDGRIAYVFDSETTSLPDVLTLMSGSVDNILIYHRHANLLYDAVSKYVPYQSITIYTGSNGVEYLAYSPSVMKMNSPAIESDMLESRVSFADISTHNEQAFIDKIRDGLKAQLHALERKGSYAVESIDRVKALIRDIDMYDTMTMLMKFVDNAAKEISGVRGRVDKMTSAMASGSEVDSEALNDIKKNFLTLYTGTIDTIFQLKSDFNGPISSMPKTDRNAFEEKLNDVSLGLKEIEAAMNNLIKYAYSNKLIEIGEGAGSTTISDSVGNNAYLEDSDISLLSVAIGASVLNKKEQIRILDKMIRDTQAKTVRQVESDGVVANLYAKWMAVKAKNPLATYSPVMEFEDGKATGFILSDLKYGKFNKEYNKFIGKLREKYGISDFDGTPENEDDAHKFELEKEEWLAKNVERKFTEEYYKIKKSLSPYAKSLLDEADEEVRVYVNKFRDGDGHFRSDWMSDRQKDILEERRKRRRAASSMVYADGTPKQEGTMDYNAALEIIEMNKKLYKNVKYASNYDAFNAAKKKMSETLSSDQFARWEMENTRVVYSDKFWEMLSNLERAEQSPQWNRLYEIRSSLLKIHRDPNTMEVSGISISKSNQISEEIKKIDKWLSDNKINPGNYSSSFSDFAEIIPTAEYNRLEAEYASKANTPEGKIEYEKFLKDTHYINSNGYSTLYSHWSKLAPKDDSMIRREPNSIWSELDESSPWFNKNFDKSKETWGMQPKRAVYDNSTEFNKLAKNKEMLEFRNALVDSYVAANKKYSYIRRINPLKLASIPGGFWHKVTHGSGDKFMSGLREAIADEFVYREFDAGLGDYDTKDMFNADGSPVMVVPTKFVTQMANPNAISRDLMESFIFYYKAATNFENMSKKASDFELLLEGIRKTEVSDKRGGVKKVSGETNMYSKAKDLVYSEVYGRQNVNKYEFVIGRGGFADKVMNGARKMLGKEQRSYENMYGTFSVAKVWFTRILPAIKAVNLSGNIKAIFGNFAGAAIHQKIEASAGIYMTNKTYMLGNLEAIKNIPNSIHSVMSRNGSKMVSMMRYFGVSRSNEADMANLHGSRLSRALATQIWYGPYSAGDFAIKSTSMVAVMLNIKPFEGKFYQREQFISKYYPKDRKSGETIFDRIGENLYGAYEIKDGVLSITDKYKDMVTEETENYTAALLQDISRRLDGSLTGTEKTRLHRDMFGSAILLHRNYLLWGLQERFHGKMFRYDKGIESSGMYSWSNMRKMPSAIYSMLLSKIGNIARIYDAGDFKQNFSVSERYNASRIFNEYIAFMAMAALAIIINKSMGDDDDDDDRKNSLMMLAYILTLRTMVEVGALSSPIELYNLQSSPTAAQSNIKEIKNLIDMVSDGSMHEEVSSGIYEGKTKLFRSVTRLTPFWKHAYPMAIEPDYRNDERFMRSNVGSTYDIMENLMWPNNIKAQRRAKKEEAAIKEETRIEKINRLYPGGYEAYKKKKEAREARKKEIRRRRNTK